MGLVLRLHNANVWVAPGWLGATGPAAAPPDARGADVDLLLQAAVRMQALATTPQVGVPEPADALWLGEQGPVQNAQAPQQLVHYWRSLQEAVAQALARGDMAGGAPAPLEGVDPAWLAHPQHALNWQRAWRQAEDALLR